MAIYGIIMAIIFSQKFSDVGGDVTADPKNFYSGISIFASGITVGFCNLWCGYVPSLGLCYVVRQCCIVVAHYSAQGRAGRCFRVLRVAT